MDISVFVFKQILKCVKKYQFLMKMLTIFWHFSSFDILLISILVTELPAAVLEESYNHLMSGYTCINVDETQFYFPNKLQVVLTLQW